MPWFDTNPPRAHSPDWQNQLDDTISFVIRAEVAEAGEARQMQTPERLLYTSYVVTPAVYPRCIV
jgi:hypothetical protein